MTSSPIQRAASSAAERAGIWVLRALSVCGVASAVLALVITAAAVRQTLSYAAMGLVLAGPIVRLAIAARRWVRAPDRRFLVLATLVAVVLPVTAALVTSGN